ncbi:MAG: GPR endopeptidase [Ruminococcaceae bacterium]|nr:GPR endopeptidase [Oscillospiraceae bacterium]
MELRTDLALEMRQMHPDCGGVTCDERTENGVRITTLTVETREAVQKLGRSPGTYVTAELPPLTDHAFLPSQSYETISEQLIRLLPKEGTVLVAGLGNLSVTPDALGPKAASMIPATRHIMRELERSTGESGLRSCAVIAPGVLGQTGVEAAELIAAVCRSIKPSAVIAIDALASRSVRHLGCTVQISDTGIHPGSGVGNCRPSISEKELGVPVIALGVPTVVDASTLAHDLTGGSAHSVDPEGRKMIVTPSEIDLLIDRAARLVALAVNHALHPSIDPEELLAL